MGTRIGSLGSSVLLDLWNIAVRTQRLWLACLPGVSGLSPAGAIEGNSPPTKSE